MKIHATFLKYLKLNPVFFFLALCMLYGLLSWIKHEWLLTEELYRNALIERVNVQRIREIYLESKKYRVILMIAIPLSLFAKVFFTAACLYIGLFFKEIKFSYRALINLAIKAEIVFAISGTLRLLVLLSRKEMAQLDDINYVPLSLIDITGTTGIHPWLVYPLQTVSVFEASYWFLLAAGLYLWLSGNFYEHLWMVMKTYVIGIILWILVVTLFLASIF